MTVQEFLGDRFGALLLQLSSMVALATFLLLTGTTAGIVRIILLIWFGGLVISQWANYWKNKTRLDELENILNGLDKKYLFYACVEKPKSNYERRLFELMGKSGKSMIEIVSDAQANSREYQEYIESWVHEIKAPITAAGLICQNAENKLRRKLIPELKNVENHVDRVLFYARAESAERDFLIRQTRLDEIVAQAVDKHRVLLIQSGVRIETSKLEQTVYTDSKWAVFMIGQLLQNAVRYRSDNSLIEISAKPIQEQVQLMVRDNGIGIPPHELPRIFDRGFSGTNGRERGGSTGMGLYISKKLAEHMLVDLSVQSKEGNGSTISLIFPTRANLSKM